MIPLSDRLRGGLFISSMMSWSTGAFLAEQGRGAAMVQLGALIADGEDRSHEARYLLPLAQQDMVPVLAEQIRPIRDTLGDVVVALNAAVGDLESGLRMAAALREAGGDVFELNCHGGYGKLLDRGLLRAMALPEHRPRMIEWLRALCKLDTPVAVKLNPTMEGIDLDAALDDLATVEGLFGVHLNVRSQQAEEPDVDLVRRARSRVSGSLWCSGYVTTPAHIDALQAAGADCVGLAQAVLNEPCIIQKLVEAT